MKRNLIMWGAAGHARVLRELCDGLGYRLVALFDNDPAVTSPFADVPIHHGRDGFDAWRRTFSDQAVSLVAIGGGRGGIRLEIQDFLEARGFPAATVVHPTAFVAADAKLGAGTQVLAKTSVCVSAQLGRACIVNTAASVDHECTLGDGVHLAPGAILTGNVRVGDFAFIGAGAVVLPRLSIGRSATIGAGAVVTKDVPDGATLVGVPARPVRK